MVRRVTRLAWILVAEVVDRGVQLLLSLPGALFVLELCAWEVVLDFVILSLLVVLLLAVLVGRLPNELPLRSLVKLRLPEALVRLQDLYLCRLRLSIGWSVDIVRVALLVLLTFELANS